MAKVKFSALVSDMRNKLNGSVFSKNRGGNYLRNKTTPVNPQSSFQSGYRANFGGLSSSFRGLSADQIQSWNDASASFPYTDIFGDTKTLNGIQLFVKLNQNLHTAGLAAISDPPLPSPTGTFIVNSFEVNIAITEIDMNTTSLDAPIGGKVIYEFTRGVSKGRLFLKNEYRTTLTADVGTTPSPAAVYAAYVARFGVPVAGQRIGCRMRFVDRNTGQTSVASAATTIAN